MQFKTLLASLFITATSLIFISCGDDPIDEKPEVIAPDVVAVIHQAGGGPFFKTINTAMTEEAAKHDFELIFLNENNDTATSLDQIQNLIALAINPSDPLLIEEANKAKIPVLTFTTKCENPNARIISHIEPNYFQSGELAAAAMIEALGESDGEIAIFGVDLAENTQKKIKGIKAVIDRFNISRPEGKIEIVIEVPGENGSAATETALQSYPDLAGIFALNHSASFGAISFLEKIGRQDQISIIAFDSGLEGKKAILDGKTYAAPIQNPQKIGKTAIRTIADFLADKNVPDEQLIDLKLYRKAHANLK